MSHVAKPESEGPRTATPGVLPFLSVFGQLVLVGLAIYLLQIEQLAGLPSLVPVVLVGFAFHAWMPLPARPPFFLAISVAGLLVVLGLPAVWLLLLGLALFGICLLPIRLAYRVVLLVVAAAAMGALRLGRGDVEWAPVVIPVLASMFMFRTALYLFDERLKDAKASIWIRLSYFFMLPNVCFPLFPIVDYTTFRRKYFHGDTAALYQRGVQWMVRGLTHLVLYRVVYHLVLPAPWEMTDSEGVLLFVFSGYLLYLRISGQFHLIVGMLLLFGFDLPETHHRYFLASSFNDFWRRINIYWKEFVEKVFFYPFFLRFRRWGLPQPMVLAVLLTFVATWLLHSYQWFWLQGTFPITWMDALFWVVIGAFVAVNSVLEARRPRRRRKSAGFDSDAALRTTVNTIAMFALLSVLWSLWGADSLVAWLDDMERFTEDSGWMPWVIGGAVVALVGGMAAQYLGSLERIRSLRAKTRTWHSAVMTGVTALALCGVGLLPHDVGASEGLAVLLDAATTEKLNEQDQLARTRGYYENLLTRQSVTGALWRAETEKPPDWGYIKNSEVAQKTDGLLRFELLPNRSTRFKRASLSTNQWGMRDQDYQRQKPPGTYRIAVLGASNVMGAGVDDEDVFERLAEERLNRKYAGGRYDRYEILNFAVGGYLLVHQVAVCQDKVLPFEPDAVFVADHTGETHRLVHYFATKPRMAHHYPNPRMRKLLWGAGLSTDNTAEQNTALIRAKAGVLPKMMLRDIADLCGRDGAKLAWLHIPVITSSELARDRVEEDRARITQQLGMTILNLDGAFRDHSPAELALAPWDRHPNALGHRLLADALVQELVRASDELGMGLEPER